MAAPVRFVAEVSSNHNQDPKRCLALIDAAADAGCDAVKFQLFRIDSLFAPEVLAKSEKLRRRKAWELPLAIIPELAARAKSRGLAFGCTPFYLEAVGELAPYVDFLKIASYELNWLALARACAATGIELILSTGMAVPGEIEAAVAAAREAGCPGPVLLHCVSGYPAKPAEANLSAIGFLRRAFGCKAGWSDHTASPGVIHRAVHAHGAELVEFHLDLDGAGAEFQSGHCWLPGRIAQVIRDVRDGLAADGDGIKRPAPGEAGDVAWRADPGDGLRPTLAVRQEWARK
ncbi:MAG: N-acetylneuraminate synthase family protein [Desulfovibrionaceae bacterium]|nr:N-acetylneuraminate synthase family protein [Desulfovibrionaceae bacterium]MBF0512676.1 N-acetylneuraminate synthase family protein [Desulfovibrionaceae bacterium]